MSFASIKTEQLADFADRLRSFGKSTGEAGLVAERGGRVVQITMTFRGFLADGPALKKIASVKGASGKTPCADCRIAPQLVPCPC